MTPPLVPGLAFCLARRTRDGLRASAFAAGCAALCVVLAGCAAIPRVESNADRLAEAAKQAGEGIASKNEGVLRNTWVALADLAMGEVSPAARSLDTLIRDGLVEGLAGKVVILERDPRAQALIAREAAGALSGSVLVQGRAAVGAALQESFGSTTAWLEGRASLPGATVLLAYRVLDAGVGFVQSEGSWLERRAVVYVYYELIDVRTGRVLVADRYRGIAGDPVHGSRKLALEAGSSLVPYVHRLPTVIPPKARAAAVAARWETGSFDVFAGIGGGGEFNSGIAGVYGGGGLRYVMYHPFAVSVHVERFRYEVVKYRSWWPIEREVKEPADYTGASFSLDIGLWKIGAVEPYLGVGGGHYNDGHAGRDAAHVAPVGRLGAVARAAPWFFFLEAVAQHPVQHAELPVLVTGMLGVGYRLKAQ